MILHEEEGAPMSAHDELNRFANNPYEDGRGLSLRLLLGIYSLLTSAHLFFRPAVPT